MTYKLTADKTDKYISYISYSLCNAQLLLLAVLELRHASKINIFMFFLVSLFYFLTSNA